MSDLVFHPVSLEEYESVYAYMSRYGEGSCQHSFVTLYSLYEKYGDEICIQDGFLYTLRKHLCDENTRVYLAPMGGGDLKAAYDTILEDAHAHGAKAKFYTLTAKHVEFLREAFPDRFQYEESRDLAEYMYRSDTLAGFKGSYYAERRREVRRFWEAYGDSLEIRSITPSDFSDIQAFEQSWLEMNAEDHDMSALTREARAISRFLEAYDALHLSGIVLRVEGKVIGFHFGAMLNDEYYDALFEKADTAYPNCYKVIRQESAKHCAASCQYINLEEDVGVEGLRRMKLMYHPEFLLVKTIATEK